MNDEFKLEMAAATEIGRKNYMAAIKDYEALFKLRSSIYDLEGIANCYEKLGNPEKAISYIEKALDIKPNNFRLIKSASTLYQKVGNHSEAYRYITKGLENLPQDPDIPKYILWLLKLISFFPKFKDADVKFKNALSKDQKWINWAIEYKKWYEKRNEKSK